MIYIMHDVQYPEVDYKRYIETDASLSIVQDAWTTVTDGFERPVSDVLVAFINLLKKSGYMAVQIIPNNIYPNN